ncbi:MAG: winged helix-turn-helix transcriptional regulator [Fimbriimonadaceae bacterium]|nr:winged helix-turn-helix transcriptional regulator [Fimbriimonadaceae bacterium]
MEQESLGAQIGVLYDLQTGYLEPRFREIGLSWGTFQLLAAIQSAPHGISQIEVARRLGVTPATLSETVFAHVQKGLVEQVPSNSDRRVKLLRLTANAKKLLKKASTDIDRCESSMKAGLSEKELSTLAALLRRVETNLESAATSV